MPMRHFPPCSFTPRQRPLPGDRHQVVLRAVSFEHAGDQVDHVALADRVEVELDARIVLDEPVPFDADFAVAHQRQDRIDVRCFLSLFSGETPRFDERFDGDVVHAVAQTAHGVGGQNVVDQVAVERVALAAVDAAQRDVSVEDRHRMFHLFVERHDFGVDFVGRQGRPGFDAEGRSEYGTLDRDVVRRRRQPATQSSAARSRTRRYAENFIVWKS